MSDQQTPGGVQTPLALLRDRVVRFPARREEVKRLETLEQFAKIVSELRVQVGSLRKQQSHIGYVFQDCSTSDSERSFETLWTRADGLSRVIAKGPEAWDSDGRRGTQDLNRAVEAARMAVQREWKREVDAVVSKYDRLGRALLKAGMDSDASIRDALERVRRLADPPVKVSEAKRAAESVHLLAPTVARLGVSGVVGEFLVAALAGTATAQDLRDPILINFLDDNRLWDMLSVSIR